MNQNENNKKLRKELIWVIAIASLILIVAAVFVTQYVIDVRQQERGKQKFTDETQKMLDRNDEKSDKIRSELNKDLVGIYQSMGDVSSNDLATAVGALTLSPDGTAKAQTYDGNTKNGWWSSTKKGDIDLIAVAIEGIADISVYQVYNSTLIDTRSVYTGKVSKEPYFDTVFEQNNPKGQMSITLSKNGKAKGLFLDTNEESENNGVTFSMSGSYNASSGFIDITLNSATTHFIMFDYNIDNSETDSGIASIFFEKVE